MRHLYIPYSSVLLASLCLISCGGIDRQKHDLAFHASHIWSFTSASDITNRFSDRSASFQLVVQGTSQFLVVSEQFKSTAIVDSLVYERFAANLWHLRGIVSSYSGRDVLVRSVLTNGILSLYRDDRLQSQFATTAEQEMLDRQGLR